MPILDDRTLEFLSHSPEQTRRVGVRLGEMLHGGHPVWLAGGLGSGETTLTQGVGRGVGAAIRGGRCDSRRAAPSTCACWASSARPPSAVDMLLAVDTATEMIGLAVTDGERILAEQGWAAPRHATAALAPEGGGA